MIEIPLIISAIGFLGMVVIIARHVSDILELSHVDSNGIASHQQHDAAEIKDHAMSLFEDIDRLIKTRAIPFFFWIAEHFFAIIEKGSKYIMGVSKYFRLTMHERSVKPRESLYWNEMKHWKDGETKKKVKDEE